jgi:choline dehydrogenase-like flavoprotein
MRVRLHCRWGSVPSDSLAPHADSSTGGASGCVVAARLAQSERRPKVLLLEAGSDNGDVSYRVPADRFKTFQEASMNWGYKTVPQNHLKGQQIDYSRGKGLGGSTAINFSCWIVGVDEDYNEVRKRGRMPSAIQSSLWLYLGQRVLKQCLLSYY